MKRLDLVVAALLFTLSFPLILREMGDPPRGALRLSVIQGDSRLDLPLREGVSWTRRIEDGTGGYNVLEVDGTRVRIREANCPDLLCVSTGWIDRPGQTIVCLPHRLVVRIEGAEGGLDGVSR